MAGNRSKAGRVHRRVDHAVITGAPNRGALWGALIVEELVRQGVTRFFAAPGSRSTPLVLAAAAHPRVELIMHFDERGLGFAALGAGRAGHPSALITTSGTAVANLLPAVVESSLDHVPLILLTADRPAELRDTASNQTIDQVKLFGRYVRWFAELPSPQEPSPAAAVLTAVDQAVARACGSPAGPVQINIPLREPLAPEREEFDREAVSSELRIWLARATPFTCYAPAAAAAPAQLRRIAPLLRRGPGVLVAGALASDAERIAVLALGRRLGWPVLADVLSGLRASRDACVVRHADPILLSDSCAAALRPGVIVQVGGRTISRRVQEWIQASQARAHVRIHDSMDRLDPGHTVTHRVMGDIAGTCSALKQLRPAKGPRAYLAAWQRWDRRVEQSLARVSDLSEPSLARGVARAAPREATLVLASSMPVRDVDQFASVSPMRVHANRGASGIDGTVATAAGIAMSTPGPTVLHIGDLALLHDLNSLALLSGHRRPFVIVCVNNDGGGIFSLLPVARFPAHFERCFGTPHGLGFRGAAAMFKWAYAAPATRSAFNQRFAQALRRAGPTLIEVRTGRGANAQAHRELQSRLRALLDRQP